MAKIKTFAEWLDDNDDLITDADTADLFWCACGGWGCELCDGKGIATDPIYSQAFNRRLGKMYKEMLAKEQELLSKIEAADGK